MCKTSFFRGHGEVELDVHSLEHVPSEFLCISPHSLVKVAVGEEVAHLVFDARDMLDGQAELCQKQPPPVEFPVFGGWGVQVDRAGNASFRHTAIGPGYWRSAGSDWR